MFDKSGQIGKINPSIGNGKLLFGLAILQLAVSSAGVCRFLRQSQRLYGRAFAMHCQYFGNGAERRMSWPDVMALRLPVGSLIWRQNKLSGLKPRLSRELTLQNGARTRVEHGSIGINTALRLQAVLDGKLITSLQFLVEEVTTCQTSNHCSGRTIVAKAMIGRVGVAQLVLSEAIVSKCPSQRVTRALGFLTF